MSPAVRHTKLKFGETLVPKEIITTTEQAVGFAQTNENIDLLKTTLTSAGTNLSDNELRLFLYQAKQTGLDPLARQLYVMRAQGKLTFMTSIDGQRLVAQRTGQYEGQVGPQWCGKDGQWRDVWLEDENPSAARVGVYRTNFREPVWGVATWKSYHRTKSDGHLMGVWGTAGDVMLAKCAEALAIRKAFPQELSGMYTSEEMGQNDESAPKSRTATKPNSKPAAAAPAFDPSKPTAAQSRRIMAQLSELGFKSDDDKHQVYTGLTLHESFKELTAEEAPKLIDTLQDAIDNDDAESMRMMFITKDGEE